MNLDFLRFTNNLKFISYQVFQYYFLLRKFQVLQKINQKPLFLISSSLIEYFPTTEHYYFYTFYESIHQDLE